MNKRKIIFNYDTVRKIACDLKGQGKRIVLTHGAFDLFHASHLDLLQKSALAGDYFIVGVDSNTNVATYKSYKRPIVDEYDRMNIIGELNCVDAVFLNTCPLNIESYIYLYKELFVDIVSIGTHVGFRDRILEQTRRSGSELLEVQTKQYPSTSLLIEKILGNYKNEQQNL